MIWNIKMKKGRPQKHTKEAIKEKLKGLKVNPEYLTVSSKLLERLDIPNKGQYWKNTLDALNELIIENLFCAPR
jgi:hypothetical protein